MLVPWRANVRQRAQTSRRYAALMTRGLSHFWRPSTENGSRGPGTARYKNLAKTKSCNEKKAKSRIFSPKN